ncbi:amino acid adenylation domain-containing protein [Streptomyces jumonjinensis]|uniref:amino acid adenylation domain-containing protein n=1 Tax=Streptomyces jumonjinensis TaxID=1945 RepID=UPI0037923120
MDHAAQQRPIGPRPASATRLPLSHAQEHLWFLDRLTPGQHTYNAPMALRLRGPLDTAVLAKSLTEVVARNEILRTRYPDVDGTPLQMIDPPAPLPLPVHDLSGITDPRNRWTAAEAVVASETRAPFDLAQGPLVRPLLIRLAPDDHILQLSLHHISVDGWSGVLLVRELAAFYTSLATGSPLGLTTPRLQYADYALRQREQHTEAALGEQVAYWRRQLAGAPALELPTDRSRPAQPTGEGSGVRRVMPPELGSRLAGFARDEHASPFMVLLAGFNALLHRYTGQSDISVGVPSAGRPHPEVENLIGFFVNMFVARTDLRGDPTFRELVERVRDVVLDASEYQDVPFERLVSELRPARSVGRNPLFQVSFQLEHGLPERFAMADVETEPLDFDAFGASRFDLSVLAILRPDGLVVEAEYSTELFERERIQRLLEHLEVLLTSALAAPDTRVSELAVISEEETAALAEWCGAAHAVPSARVRRRVDQLIAARALHAPGATALQVGDTAITYGRLVARSDDMAARLRRAGVAPEAVVGVCLERSADLVVALMAVIRAGGAYVPLDPADPPARIGYVLADSGARLVLVGAAGLPEGLELPEDVSVLCIGPGDDGGSGEDGEPAVHSGPVSRAAVHSGPVSRADRVETPDAPGRPAPSEAVESARPTRSTVPSPVLSDPEGIAYLIYTSGSTGRPKGVMVRHGGLSQFVEASAAHLGVGRGTRVLQFTSAGFDASILEIFTTLCAGGAVCLIGREERLGRDLAEAIRSTGTTLAFVPPTALATLDVTGLPSLRTVVTGGEPCPPAVASRLAAHPGIRFFNAYGPTESTVIVTFEEVTRPSGTSPPIGRPLPGTRLYVVDQRLRRVPVGLPGELLVGGAQLARGYRGRPGLTAARFIPDPFGDEPGGRLYRTGDLVRYRADGGLEFLSRVDRQVKVRGFRIELDEIEAALGRQPQVRACAVTVRPNSTGEQRIAAYVTVTGEVTAAELRTGLGEWLPAHMIPSDFAVLDDLPLTSGGKIDRTALSATAIVPDGHEPAMPRELTAIEAATAEIFQDVLGRPVGPADDFFALGGNSLQVARIASRIEARFGARVRLRDFYTAPTVEKLAGLVEQARSSGTAGNAEGAHDPLLLARPAGPASRAPLYLVHPSGGSALCYRELASLLARTEGGAGGGEVYGFDAPGLDSVPHPFTGIEELAASHVRALLPHQPQGPYHLGGWSTGGAVAFEMARQLTGLGHEVPSVVLFDSSFPGAAPVTAESMLHAFVSDLAGLTGRAVPETLPGPLDQQSLLALIEEYALLPGGVGIGDVRNRLAVFMATVGAIDTYVPRRVDSELVVVRAADAGTLLDAWPEFGTAGSRIRTVPGTHYSMFRAPYVHDLVRALTTS